MTNPVRLFLSRNTLIFIIAMLTISIFALSPVNAATWFVAPKGNDANSGTIDAPFATLQKGHDKASAGDTVFLRGGTYTFAGSGATTLIGVSITKSGKSDKQRIYFWAYPGELPILDFAELTLASGIGAGIRVQGEWLHFKGLEICNVMAPSGANNGIWCNPCSNNIFENMNFHHNEGPGLSIANGNGGLLILNCDAHDNYDKAKNGEDADGFGVHYQTKGDTITFRGCRAWWNSDDGYDLFKQQFPVVIENCWAYGNGYINSGTGNGQNGSGFKMGNTFAPKVRHTIRNCVAWKNKAQGFYANHSPGGSNWYNNTSYNNGAQFDMLSDSVLSGDIVHVLRNNVAFPKKINNAGASDMKFNTWDLNITPANSDFISVSDSGWMGPRKPDGSLPELPFLKLKPGGNLVDKGTDVGIPFSGKAADLGAYESGDVSSSLYHHVKSTETATLFPDSYQTGHTIFDLAGRTIRTPFDNKGFRVLIKRQPTGRTRVLFTGTAPR